MTCQEPTGASRSRDTRAIVAGESRPVMIDVSEHQGVIDWPALARWSGVAGVIIKSTEGRDWIDPRFKENRQGAEDAGVAWGAYHMGSLVFKGKAMEPIAAARDHVEAVGDDCDLGSWFDLETREMQEAVDLKGETWACDYVEAWLDEYQRLTGREAGLYLSHRGLRLMGKHAPRFDRHARWWAYYYGDSGALPSPLATRPGKPGDEPWALWQFTSKGRCVGIGDGESNVDVIVVNPASDIGELLT